MNKQEKLDKLVDLICKSPLDYCEAATEECVGCLRLAKYLIDHGVTVQECARSLEEWHEDYGDVLWWKFPIEEPPYAGSPLDEKWDGYYTHWTPIVVPEPPKEVE